MVKPCKKGSVAKLQRSLFCYLWRLALGDSAHGTFVCATTTVDAGISVNHIVIVTRSDGRYGTCALTCTTAHTGVVNNIGQNKHHLSLSYRYCNTSNLNYNAKLSGMWVYFYVVGKLGKVIC